MPIAMAPDDQTGWLVARVTGHFGLIDALEFIRTARSGIESRSRPLLFDARGATTTMVPTDVDAAVAMVEQVVASQGMRAHVALVADDDHLYAMMLAYEAKCAEVGVRVIRVFRRLQDAEQWLGIMAAARNFR